MSYNDKFGNTLVSASGETYQSITTGTSFSFVWPSQYVATGTVLTGITEVTAGTSNIVLSMPPANQSSVGANVQFKNVGGTAFTIGDNNGNTITSIGTTQAFEIYLKDNSSAGGTWGATQMGSGAASANAGAIAGPGLQAVGALLEQGIGYRTAGAGGAGTLYATDLGTLVDWTTGAGTLTLLGGTLYGTNFIGYFRNSGSGAVTAVGNNIDNIAPTIFQPSDGATIVCDGTSLHTVGRLGAIAATIAGNGLQAIGNVLAVKPGGWPVSVSGTGVSVSPGMGTTTNTDNSFALAITGFDGTYLAGQPAIFSVASANTGTLPTTLNVNSIGAGTVFKPGPAGPVVIGTGDWQANQKVVVVNDGTNWWQVSELPQTETFLTSLNVAAGTVPTFAGYFSTNYNTYRVRFRRITTTQAAAMYMRVAFDANGTTAQVDGNYLWAANRWSSSSSNTSDASGPNGATQIEIVPTVRAAASASQVFAGDILVYDAVSATAYKPIQINCTSNGTTSGTSGQFIEDSRISAYYVGSLGTLTGVSFPLSTGTYISGHFSLYGIRD